MRKEVNNIDDELNVILHEPSTEDWAQEAKIHLHQAMALFRIVYSKKKYGMATLYHYILSPDAAIAALRTIDANGDNRLKRELGGLDGYFNGFKAQGYMARTATVMRLCTMLQKRGLTGVTK